MTKLPPLKAREVVKGLKALGFEKVRQKGSHAIFHHQDCRERLFPFIQPKPSALIFSQIFSNSLRLTRTNFYKLQGVDNL